MPSATVESELPTGGLSVFVLMHLESGATSVTGASVAAAAEGSHPHG